MDVNMNVRNGIVGKETWPLLKDGRVLGSGGQSERRALHTRGLLSPAAWLPGAPRPPHPCAGGARLTGPRYLLLLRKCF